MEAVILECGDFPKKEYPRELLRRADVIICCDRALDTFLRHRDKIFKDLRDPDAIIGDMDSISPKHLKEYSRIAIREEEQETNDQTKAFRYLLEHWPEVKTVHILGATGKREAHTLGNLGQIMEYARLYGASGNPDVVARGSDDVRAEKSGEVQFHRGGRPDYGRQTYDRHS